MKNRERFFLVLLTIFASMFLISFYICKEQYAQINRMKRIIKAYELFAMGKYPEFSNYVEQNRLNELLYLKKDLQKRLFLDYYANAVYHFNLGNYAEAADLFKKALEQIESNDPKSSEILYLLCVSLTNANRLGEARLVLEQSIENMPNTPFKKKVMELLAEIYKKQGDHDKADKILKGGAK
ncbi:tetratricopeptide repeat protein [Pseudothermotoga thermarum]|uniref:Uncharacterized protein n=1 Tax=Pseudothermotoga thermarum DSM 5069 TaxID=688269 RepID=F7YVF5_9THEM|nr:tetratricopeptide repeat protein [Pseudothermotoga thermarum]AEH50461.1 hypothetical protein Theth_0366 [Pseudothermotoga thermarum DSM 5069]